MIKLLCVYHDGFTILLAEKFMKCADLITGYK
jgi:hypothetical protein